MEEHTDKPFRVLCKELGAALVITEMVDTADLVRGDKLAKRMLVYAPGERPIAGQLLGAGLDETVRAARMIEELGFDLLDLNLSCPIRRVIAKDQGGAYLKDPARIEALFKAVTAAVRIPVTLKCRSGWDVGHPGPEEIVRAAEQGGCAGVILHARTVVQAYKGPAEWGAIARAKAAVKVPVGGAGGIRVPEDALRMQRETGCDLLLLARGILGNPWLIPRTLALLRGDPVPPPPSREERLRLALRHVEELARWHGWKGPNGRLVRQALYWGKDEPDFPKLRQAVQAARTLPELHTAMKDWFRGRL